MREIKFRLFSKVAQSIIEWEQVKEKPHLIWDGRYIEMQFTGLTDSKGVEIYDGDIIHYGYYEDLAENDDLTRPMNFSVKWSTADGGWTANGRLIDWDKNGIYDREVIGNIHSGNLTWK